MDVIPKYYLAVTLTLLSSFSLLLAQNTTTQVQGILSINDGTPAVGAFVTLVSSEDSLTPLDFTVVGEDGGWQIVTSIQGRVFLSMRYMGYEPYFEPLQIAAGDSLYFEVQLRESAIAVKELEITEKAIDIVQRGDTLRYNVKNFMNGSEQTLGDVLRKLPGFELNANQQITYNGKKIDKILIEGRDILNDQHQLANEGISADDLLAVDIINKFKDRKKQFSGEGSNELALNIDLDNQDKAIWSGKIDLAGGYQNRYKADNSLIGVGTNYGLTSFVKGNNTGEAVISQGDFFRIQSMKSLLKLLRQSGGNLEQLLPAELVMPNDLQSNNDWLVSANGEYETTKGLKVNTSILTLRLDRLSAADFVRTYVGDNQIFIGEYQKQAKLSQLSTQTFVEYEWKDRLLMEISLPFSIQKTKTDQAWNGVFNEIPSNTNQDQTVASWSIMPELYMDYKINPKTHLIGTFLYSYRNRERDNDLLSVDTLFDFNQIRANQSWRISERVNSAELNFYHQIEKIKLGVTSSLMASQQTLNANSVPILANYEGENTFLLNTAQLSPYLKFQNKDWLINSDLALTRYQIEMNGKKSIRTRLNPKLGIRYSFSQLHYLLFSFKMNNKNVTINETTDIIQIEDGQTLRLGGLSGAELPFSQSYSLVYANLNAATRTMFNVNLSYSRQLDVVSNQLTNQDDFVAIRSVIQPFQNNFTGNILLLKPIAKNKMRLKATLSHQQIESTLLQQNEQVREWIYRKSSASIAFKSNKAKYLDYNIGINFSTQRQRFDANEGQEQVFTTVLPNLTLSLHQSEWTFKSKISYLHFVNTAPVEPFINWNAEISYAPSDSRWTFSMIGNNLLNLNPREQAQFQFTPVFIEAQTFNAFSGFVLLQLSYQIRYN